MDEAKSEVVGSGACQVGTMADGGGVMDIESALKNTGEAYEPTTRKNRTVEEAAISKTETTIEPCSECRLYQRFVLGDGVK